jgi:FkbM family methyltransferase
MAESENFDRRTLLLGTLGGVVAGGAAGFFAGWVTGTAPPETPQVGADAGAAPVAASHVAPPPPAPPRETFGYLSFAQQGEDLVMKSMLDMAGLPKPTYIDIGAHHPIRDNNTFLFYTQGARGVLVEPNPKYAALLREKRPGDTVLEVGIGIAGHAEADYYLIDGDGQLNTFSKEQADKLVKLGRKVEKVIKRELVELNKILEVHFKQAAPDVLSIDVEGLDLAILKTLDFARFRPRIICVETAELGAGTIEREIHRLLEKNGYTARGGSFPNTIFLDDKMLKVYASTPR